MSNIETQFPLQERRVTRDDALTCLAALLPILARRHPPLWRDVLRAFHADRLDITRPELDLVMALFKSPSPHGLLGRVPDSLLRWNVAVRCYWDAEDEMETRLLVVGVWREGPLGSVRTWQGQSALGLVKRALKVLEEDQQ